jgi:hypothetical protein
MMVHRYDQKLAGLPKLLHLRTHAADPAAKMLTACALLANQEIQSNSKDATPEPYQGIPASNPWWVKSVYTQRDP